MKNTIYIHVGVPKTCTTILFEYFHLYTDVTCLIDEPKLLQHPDNIYKSCEPLLTDISFVKLDKTKNYFMKNPQLILNTSLCDVFDDIEKAGFDYKVIISVRNPVDTLLSLYNHWNKSSPPMFDSFKSFIKEFKHFGMFKYLISNFIIMNKIKRTNVAIYNFDNIHNISCEQFITRLLPNLKYNIIKDASNMIIKKSNTIHSQEHIDAIDKDDYNNMMEQYKYYKNLITI